MTRKPLPFCTQRDCEQKARYKGMCRAHFREWAKLNEPDKKLKDAHNLYGMWQERKSAKVLVPEWLDFWAFVDGVGGRPEGQFVLCRLTEDRLYGPDNFIWRPFVTRMEGESKKDWIARQWQGRRTRFPTYEDDRALRRKYGITLDQYKAMEASQNGTCAICLRLEKLQDHRNGRVRRLCVDHCHDTGKNRDLLCYDCNVTLGRMDESVERLEAMIRYIKKHAHPALKVVGG